VCPEGRYEGTALAWRARCSRSRGGVIPAVAVSVCAALIGTAPLDGQTAAKPPIDRFVESVQQRYDRVRDFSADFVQTYSGGVLRTSTSERGKVFIKKPGKMRWEYAAPEENCSCPTGRNSTPTFRRTGK